MASSALVVELAEPDSLERLPSFMWDGDRATTEARDVQKTTEGAVLAAGAHFAGLRRIPATPVERSGFFERLGTWLWALVPHDRQRAIEEGARHGPVRITLVEAPYDRGPGLPWEYLRVGDTPAAPFLALLDGCAIERRVGCLPIAAPTPSPVQSIGIVAGRPSGPAVSHGEPDFAHIAGRLGAQWRAANGRAAVRSVICPGDGLGMPFAEAYRKAAAHGPYIIHLLAHGDPSGLVFPDDRGVEQPVRPAGVATAAAACRAPALLLLSSCVLGAPADSRGVWDNFAKSVFAEMPTQAIVASRVSVSATALDTFCAAFQSKILAGGTIGDAIREGRRSLRATEDWSFGSWAVYARPGGLDIRFKPVPPGRWHRAGLGAAMTVAAAGLTTGWLAARDPAVDGVAVGGRESPIEEVGDRQRTVLPTAAGGDPEPPRPRDSTIGGAPPASATSNGSGAPESNPANLRRSESSLKRECAEVKAKIADLPCDDPTVFTGATARGQCTVERAALDQRRQELDREMTDGCLLGGDDAR